MRRACLPAGRKRTHEARRGRGGGGPPRESAGGGGGGWPCLLGRWTSHKRMPGLFCTPRANRLIYPLYEPIIKSIEPFAATGRRPRATPPPPSATPRQKERKGCLSAGMAKTA